ncbi:hypothetical protein NL676_026896 [Syzygium grande]|nr:hypothetical protein NL676_026896 [Syzygium grande]
MNEIPPPAPADRRNPISREGSGARLGSTAKRIDSVRAESNREFHANHRGRESRRDCEVRRETEEDAEEEEEEEEQAGDERSESPTRGDHAGSRKSRTGHDRPRAR